MLLNSIYILEILITDKTGNGATSLTVNYEIRKSSDNSLFTSGTLIEIGDGIYKDAVTLTDLGQFRIIYQTPTNYTNEIETIDVVEGLLSTEDINKVWDELLENHNIAESFGVAIRRILGLSQHNIRIFDVVYNSDGLVTSNTVKIYKNASDTNNNLDPILTLLVESTYDVNGKLTSYKATEL